jgi:UDP-N-acetylglucosamine 2-epimerase (non-hydrolysing)
LPYREFIVLEKNALFILTDSGGIQEETTFFHVPCLTLRPNTERPITITEGTNELVNTADTEKKVDLIFEDKWKEDRIPELWDGEAARRVEEVFKKELLV